MADPSSQDRNLPASQRKLAKARGEGQVVRSQHLGHFVAIAVAGAMLMTLSPWLVDWLEETVVQGLRFNGQVISNPGFMSSRLQELTVRLLAVVLPLGIIMSLAGAAASVAVGGWNWTFKPLVPQFGRLNPLTGLPGLLSKSKLLDALKASALALILGAIGALYLRSHINGFSVLLGYALPEAISHAAGSMLGGLALLLLALAVFAAIDVPLQRYQHAQRMKMSHQEVKQERREVEGNQEMKGKVRARMRELTKRRMLAAVPKADLVVMNPTHYAVALKYDDKSMGAPRVVAKGADLVAMTIRDLAKGSSVPVLQAPALARALYAHAELDCEIPAALFGAVAQVLAYVYQLRAALSGKAPMPSALPDLSVPEELDPHHRPVPLAKVDE